MSGTSDGDWCVSHLRNDHALFCSSNHIALQLVHSFMDDSKEPEDKCKKAAKLFCLDNKFFQGIELCNASEECNDPKMELSAML